MGANAQLARRPEEEQEDTRDRRHQNAVHEDAGDPTFDEDPPVVLCSCPLVGKAQKLRSIASRRGLSDVITASHIGTTKKSSPTIVRMAYFARIHRSTAETDLVHVELETPLESLIKTPQ